MVTRIHEKIPSNIRRDTPQWIKGIYSYTSIFLKKLFVSSHFWISDEQVDKYFQDKKLFFLLSIGRSGTKWLADLLNIAPRALVVHEPFIETIPHQEAFNDPMKAENYISKFRKREIWLRINTLDVCVYGEVNSFLRRHCESLKRAFPNAVLMHIVRDGRDVVRSMYSRETMMPRAYDTKRICPKENDPWRDQWQKMSRFEKLCWYWMVENTYLRECVRNTVKFEKIISDYEYFSKNILRPLNLTISKNTWEGKIIKPRNISADYMLSHWSKWGEEKESFNKICGKEMRENGYELNW